MAEGRIDGKVALITGASGGIGRSIAERFAREGALVTGGDLAAPAGSTADGIRFAELDVTSSASLARVMDAIDRAFGRLDVLVNCAGIEIEKTVEDTTEAEWDRVMSVNLKGTFLACKLALPLLRKAGQSALQRMPSGPWSTASALVSAWTPPLEAQ